MEENDVDDGTIVEKALKSFCCFLYVGKDVPCYKARPWNDDDFYLQGKRMRSLEILASNKPTELVPLDKIKLAMDTLLIQRPETLMFALAMCARQKKSKKLRTAAYYFLAEHCKEWKYFILFIKYASELTRREGTDDINKKPPIGWGRGWKNAVNKWYLNHSAHDLMLLIGRHKGGHGWKHKDILKLSHIDTQSIEPEKRAVIKYVLDGPKIALQESDNDPKAESQLNFLELTDNFRSCRDPVTAVNLMLQYKLYTIQHVHPTLLKNFKVWEALLTEVDIRTVLKYIPKLSQLGFLSKASSITELISRTLNNENNILWNKIQLAEILNVLNLYKDESWITEPTKTATSNGETLNENGSTDLVTMIRELVVIDHRFKFANNSRIRAPNVIIRDALRTALKLSQKVDITGGSKKSYVIAIRLPAKSKKPVCAQAGLAIALPLLNRPDVTKDATTIIGYEPRLGIGNIAEITKEMSYEQALNCLKKIKTRGVSMSSMPMGPIEWCNTQEKKYDVFINVTSELPRENSIDEIRRWKKKNTNDSRFINVIINRGIYELQEDICHEVLTINGSDPHVPFIIEAYVRGLF